MNFQQKNNVLIFSTIFIIAYSTLFAQQTPSFSEYNTNPFIINSAYAGLTKNPEFSLSNSGFMNSFEGTPRSFTLSGSGSVNRNKIGLGAGVLGDQIGVSKSTTFFAAASYKIYFDFERARPSWQLYEPGVFSFGITFGAQQYQNNLLNLGIVGDDSFSSNINATIPIIGFGVLFNYDTFFIGFSSPNIIGDSLTSEKNLNINNSYYGYLGYRFFNNIFEDFTIKPNALFKHENGVALQIDLNVSTQFKDKFELGIGYRTDSSINVLAGIYAFNNFRLIYNYNIATNGFVAGNRHGIVLSYQIGDGYRRD